MSPTLSAEGLARLHDTMASHVEAGRLPGLVTLVARGDDVRVDTIGTASFDDDGPLARDAIFRIASLTKPITAVATMALVESGILRLDGPVDDFVPELADRRVLRAIDAELDDTVPANRSITVEDLLTSRLGFGTVMAAPDSYPIQRAEAALELRSIGGPPWPPVAYDVDGWIAALGSLPLISQPGEQWLYNTSSQVLGVLLARASGQPLESVLRERVFEPLGMNDTGFTVPAKDLGRLTTAYAPDPDTDELSVLDGVADSWWSEPTTFPDASGWLVSTIDDYWLFASMFLAGGAGRRERVALTRIGRTDGDRSPHAGATGSVAAVPRRHRELGPGHGDTGHRNALRAPAVRHRLGRRHGNHLVFRPPPGCERDPVHAARRNLAHPVIADRGLLGRRQRRDRYRLTDRNQPAAASTVQDVHVLLPRRDVSRVVVGRTIRGFADGFVSVLLAQYLTRLGFSPVQVGAIVTGTLLGSAGLTLAFGLTSHRFPLRTLLLAAAVLMTATGVGFATVTWFWPLFAVAVVGTLNPSAGDVSVFLPTEQALLAGHVAAPERPRLFAMYNLSATLAGAVGALASVLPEAIARWQHWNITRTQQAAFLVYALAGAVIFVLYLELHREVAVLASSSPAQARRVLRSSRRTVLELSALFSLDSAGSGLVVTSLLVLWLHLRFDLSAGQTGAVFFATGLLGASSQLLASRLANRLGLIRTMAFTHVPANLLLAGAAFAPNGYVAVALLLVRALFSQMDVPARQAFVMAVVPPEERAAAASVTNVPRSLASAATPLLAGALLRYSHFGWPLLIAGTVKLTYDIALFVLYRDVPERVGATRAKRAAP